MTVSPCPSGLPVLTLSHDTHTDGSFHAMFGSRKRSFVNIRVVHGSGAWLLTAQRRKCTHGAPEQLGVVTQVVQTGLHQYMESMKPMFEQLVVASTQGQGGQVR